MTEKTLRRKSRKELIEIIYETRKREESLKAENKALKERLEEKQTRIVNAGSLAELSAFVNNFFESAQKTADRYLADIKSMRDEAAANKGAQKESEPEFKEGGESS